MQLDRTAQPGEREQARRTNGSATGPADGIDVEALVRQHLPLVEYAVYDVIDRIPRSVPRADLVSAGMFGLTQAAQSYDPGRGVPFDKWARRRIQGAILDELRSRDWASRSVRAQARALQTATDDLTARLQRPPTQTELAQQTGMDEEQLSQLTDDVHRATVLNYDSVFMEQDENDLLPADGGSPDDVLLARETRAYLHDAIVALPERLRHVVVGYFFEERPMQELADELGVTESRISQMRAEALAMLEEGINSQLDPERLPAAPEASARVAQRKASYYAAVAAASDYRSRLTATPAPITERVKRTESVA